MNHWMGNQERCGNFWSYAEATPDKNSQIRIAVNTP